MTDTGSNHKLVESVFIVGHTAETLSKSNLNGDPSEATQFEDKEFQGDADLHPLDRRFSPKLLLQYPTDPGSMKTSLQSVGMFCFPNGMKLHHENAPNTLWHSFVMTEENGAKLYGVCIIVHEKLSPESLERLRVLCQNWKFDTSKLKLHEAVFFNHVSERMTIEKDKLKEVEERLEKAEGEEEKAVLRRIINDYGEKILLYKQILGSYERHVDFPEHIYIPKAIGLLSRYPFIDLFRDYLSALVYHSSTGLHLPLERYLINLVEEIPPPPRGKVEVEITLDKHKFYCSRPPLNKIPVLKNFSLFPLFRALSVESIVQVIECILAERKIIVYSKHLAALSVCLESFLALIFPFYWHYIYIPVLPASLLGYLQAPVPYIVGIHSSCKDIESPPNDATVIDLEASHVRVGLPPPQIPSRERTKLISRLEMFAMLKLPPGVETTPVFGAFPGGRLVTTTHKSSVQDPDVMTVATLLTDDSGDLADSRKLSADGSESSDSNSGDVIRQRSVTETPSSRRPPSFVPRANPERVLQKSLQSIQTTLNVRKSIVKNFFTGSEHENRTTSPTAADDSASSSSTAMTTTSQADPKTRRSESLFDPQPISTPAPSAFVTKPPASSLPPRPQQPEAPVHFFNETLIQESFLKCLCSLLLNYRKFLKPPTEDEWNGTNKLELFKSKEFLAQLDGEKKAFMTSILETQAFSQFVLERIVRDANDYEVLFFDETIKSKKNRSVFTLTKESTPFLNDHKTFAVMKTHQAAAPNDASIPPDSLFTYSALPSTLEEKYMCEPRVLEALGSSKEDLELKAHTSALTRRARLEKIQKTEKRFWATPQFNPSKAKDQKHAPKSDEDRSLMFDYILENVYNKIQQSSIEAADLPNKTTEEITAACNNLYEQQRVLITAAEDEQLVEKNNAEDLQRSLRTIINYITQYEEVLRSRNATESVTV